MSEDRLASLYWADRHSVGDAEYARGLEEAEYHRRCAKVQKLELFMNTLQAGDHISDFVNLRELALHLESFPSAVPLGGLTQLQRLAVTECGLRAMGGIEACAQLTHLDLSQNVLTEMDPAALRPLSKLRTLWLNENRIGRIRGLEGLDELTSLWLGRNRITAVGDALLGTPNLEEINLAGNLISNFKDIPTLARMRKLSSLAFGEPHYGDNPLCVLCNYQTYVLFHISQLRTFDAVLISDELRQLAEATYMKKKM